MGVISFLFIYTLGGVTFLPLLVIALFLHAYLTFPVYDEGDSNSKQDQLLRDGDTDDAVKSGIKAGDERFHPPRSPDADVAAGYFAVCRDYVPGGINGKPPERTTPTGSTVISSPSPSIYQNMYRSIFDRKQAPSPLDNKGMGKPQNKGGNVFYVVLRHSHLLLFDDDTMMEVRYVLSLAHHDINIYGGGEFIPEGELFIKRNALCLTRKTDAGEFSADGVASKPFYLFCENLSEKEDFYFAMLKSQERTPEAQNNPPVPLQFEVKHMITLVQRLHSSEEHLQTRWINALLGRLFLSLYKTSDVEHFIRSKITKKISRVKKPSFLSRIVLRHVDMGEGAPYIINPRLKDLTVDGDCVLEADLTYSGNFRLEIAATARIDLGTRFKAREVDLILAVVLKKVEGHVLFKVKPPPSNRIWFTFATAPHIDMTIEPVVSARQITYPIILRQIESRIKEVIAESIVMPFWDDLSFFPTEGKKWRGGIWVDDVKPHSHHEPHTVDEAAEDGQVDELEHLEASPASLPAMESSLSVPLMDASPPPSVYARKNARSLFNLGLSSSTASSTSIDKKSISSDTPRAIRHGSFTSNTSPLVGTEFTNVDGMKAGTPPSTSAMAALAARAAHGSPVQTPVGSPSRTSGFREKSGSQSSASSVDSKVFAGPQHGDETVRAAQLADMPLEPTFAPDNEEKPDNAVDSNGFSKSGASNTLEILSSHQESEASSIKSTDLLDRLKDSESVRSLTGSLRNRMTSGPADASSVPADASSVQQSNKPQKRMTMHSVASVAASARRWGLSAIQRSGEQKTEGSSNQNDNMPQPNQPMGRGRPLPPPGMPLPRPDRKTPTAPIPVPKRKIVPPPILPQRPADGNSKESLVEPETLSAVPGSDNASKRDSTGSQLSGPPPLPKRRSKHIKSEDTDQGDDGLLVVAAPELDSEPTTPQHEARSNYLPPWVDDDEEDKLDQVRRGISTPPRLPARRRTTTSSSPEEDDSKLPTWMVAQEEESRAKTLWVDEDGGHDY